MGITTQTYAHTRDDQEPVRLPDSAIVASAARVVAICQERGRAIVQHGPDNLPIELVRLSAAARQLVLDAAAFVTHDDRQARLAKAAGLRVAALRARGTRR